MRHGHLIGGERKEWMDLSTNRWVDECGHRRMYTSTSVDIDDSIHRRLHTPMNEPTYTPVYTPMDQPLDALPGVSTLVLD